MAIQIRRGSNAEWEVNNSNIVVGEPAVATDSKRAFIGTASGAYMELANLEAIAPAYDPGNSYMVDDYVSYQGKLYVCTVPTSGAWNASCWQVTSLGQALAENAYSNFETYTMSGDIVSFPNGAGGIPVKDLKADVVAVQNLNGYDNPWVGGAGKNIFDYDQFKNASGWTESNGTYSGTLTNLYVYAGYGTAFPTPPVFKANTQYTLSVNVVSCTGIGRFRVEYSDSTYTDLVLDSTTGYKTATTTSGKTISKFFFTYNTSGNCSIKEFQIEEGTSRTTWQPYSNICPISGWDEVNVTRTGKNLLKTTATSKTQNNVTFTINSDGSITVSTNGTASALTTLALSSTCFLKQGTYIVSGCPSGGSSSTFELSLGLSGVINKTNDYGSGATFTAPSDVTLGYVQIVIRSGQSVNKTFYPMIRKATDSSTYEPYNGTTYPITWTSAGTVYKGTLDVTTGLLTATHGYVDLGSLTWTLYYGTVYANVSGAKLPQSGAVANIICSQYKASNIASVLAKSENGIIAINEGQSRVNLYDASLSDKTAEEVKTAMNGVQLVYELATPQVVQLTPTQITTLLGQNNIWADSGSVEVTYRISNVQ